MSVNQYKSMLYVINDLVYAPGFDMYGTVKGLMADQDGAILPTYLVQFTATLMKVMSHQDLRLVNIAERRV